MNRERVIPILQTERYAVDVAPRKNRLYLRVRHEGQGLPDVPQALEKLHEVAHYLSHGFTLLMELCETPLNPEAMNAQLTTLLRDTMDLLCEGGLCKIAQVCPAGLIPQKSIRWHGTPRRQGVQQKDFPSREAAEAWLDLS